MLIGLTFKTFKAISELCLLVEEERYDKHLVLPHWNSTTKLYQYDIQQNQIILETDQTLIKLYLICISRIY